MERVYDFRMASISARWISGLYFSIFCLFRWSRRTTENMIWKKWLHFLLIFVLVEQEIFFSPLADRNVMFLVKKIGHENYFSIKFARLMSHDFCSNRCSMLSLTKTFRILTHFLSFSICSHRETIWRRNCVNKNSKAKSTQSGCSKRRAI